MLNILDYIPYGHENAVKRGTLIRQTGLNDRAVRRLIEKAQFDGDLIINLQDGAGYFRPILPDEEALLIRYQSAESGRLYASTVKLRHMDAALGEV